MFDLIRQEIIYLMYFDKWLIPLSFIRQKAKKPNETNDDKNNYLRLIIAEVQQKLQLTLLNSLYIHKMQIPASRSSDTQPSMFQAILEECSSKQIEIEEIYNQHHQNLFLGQQIFREQVPRSPNIWFMMDEVPFDNILDQQQPIKQDTHLQFHKVKSFREQQQTKIAQFLRDDKSKSLRNIEIPQKNSSPLGKPSQSLSPRKTKKIDKSKGLKFFPQSD